MSDQGFLNKQKQSVVSVQKEETLQARRNVARTDTPEMAQRSKSVSSSNGDGSSVTAGEFTNRLSSKGKNNLDLIDKGLEPVVDTRYVEDTE